MEKDRLKKALLIKMDPEMHKLLKIRATEYGENMTTVVLRLIQDYLSETPVINQETTGENS